MKIFRYLLSSAVLALLLVASSASAQETAETLFQGALSKMKEGRFAEACPMLERSQALEAKSGTLISLGFCRERIGKTASAWGAYREAAQLAQAEGRDDYVEKAQRLATTVSEKLSKYRIVAAPTPGLEVKVDGQLVPRAMLGREVAVDPGRITIVASAPSHDSWTKYVDVLEPGTETVEVPALTKTFVPVAPTAPEGPSTLGIVGWTLTGVGGVGSVVGFVLGGLVLDRKSTVDEECDQIGRTCSQAGLDASEQGSDFALGSTIAVIGGLALVATGVTLVVVDGFDDDQASGDVAIRIAPQRGGARLGVEVTF